jgi:hypothetical protein
MKKLTIVNSPNETSRQPYLMTKIIVSAVRLKSACFED